MAKTLRPYQQDAITASTKALKEGISKQIIVLPTGGGKTFTAVKALSPFKKRLWVSSTEELIDQSGGAFLNELCPEIDLQTMIDTHGSLSDYLKAVRSYSLFSDASENEILKNIGIIKAEAFDIEADIIMASAQTLHRRLNRMQPEMFDAIVADECHEFCAATYVKGINFFQPKLLLGLTATPIRSDGAQLGDIFEQIVYQYNLIDAIDDGYLCEIDAIQCKTNLTLDNVRTTAGEFNQKDLKQTVDTPERNKLLVEKYKLYADGLQNLVFCVDVEHTQNVCNTFKDAGYKAEFIVGNQELSPDRKAIINRFKTGQTQVLVNCMILTKGFDYPGIKCLTLAAPTKSITKFMQQLGRSTRTLSGVIDGLETKEERKKAIASSAKPKAIVLDIVDTSSRHRIINTWSLDKDVPIEKRVFTTTEKKEKLIDARKKREFEAITKKDKRIDLFKLPTVKYSKSIKMTDPATEKQLDFLKSMGYDTTENTYTKGSANLILSNLPATEKQIAYLRWKNYDTLQGVTRAEAVLAFKQIKEKEDLMKEEKQIDKNLPIQGLS